MNEITSSTLTFRATACRAAAASAPLFFETLSDLQFGLSCSIAQFGLDAECIVIEHGSAEKFFELVAQLPAAFRGDLLLVRPDGRGFLSTVRRTGHRSLYLMPASEVRSSLGLADPLVDESAYDERRIA